MPKLSYSTPSGIAVTRSDSQTGYKKGLKHLLHKLDRFRGIYLSSGYEYPERYSRWDVASICPPLEIVAAGRDIDWLSRRFFFQCWNTIRTGTSLDFKAQACMAG